MRIVVDTNAVVSGPFWQGPPRKRHRRWPEPADHSHHRSEPARRAGRSLGVLAREKFSSRIRQARLSAKALVAGNANRAHVVVSATLSESVTRDPNDDEVIACALTAGAEAIASGDGDLLTVEEYERIPILSTVQALYGLTAGRRVATYSFSRFG